MAFPLAIAMDLGGTQVRAALFEHTRIMRRSAFPTDVAGGLSAILAQLEALVSEVLEDVDKQTVAGIGISSAGPIDTQTGIVLGIPTISGLEGFPLRSALSERTGLPVHIENDAIAAAYGEWRHGAGRGLQHMAYLTVSTGIGGGIVVDGRLMHGRRGMAAHIGHMRLAQDGPKCSCGATACFEAFASGKALGDRARSASSAKRSGFLGLQSLKGEVDARHVFEGARAGDSQCLSLVEEEAEYLGQGITSIIHIFSPERVVMGGGLSQAFDLLEAGIHTVIRTNAIAPFKEVRVFPAELGDNSGLVGMAAMVLERPGT